MEPPRILVIEDSWSIREGVAAALERARYEVRARPDGETLESDLAEFRPDLTILDVMLPGRNGFELASQVRGRSGQPILFLTAKDALADRLTGFDVGGDDYVVKPVEIEELLARVRVLLRRCGRVESATIALGDVLVDEGTAEVVRAGVPIALTPTEFRLLSYLARNRGLVLSRVQILAHVWGYDAYDSNLVDVHVASLRRKLEACGPRVIHTVRGHGYLARA
jgi:two-component system, OmpR family, response regulator